MMNKKAKDIYWPVAVALIAWLCLYKFIPDTNEFLSPENIEKVYSYMITVTTFITGFSFVALEILISSNSRPARKFIASEYFGRFKQIISQAVLAGIIVVLAIMLSPLIGDYGVDKIYFITVLCIMIGSILQSYNAHRIAFLFALK